MIGKVQDCPTTQTSSIWRCLESNNSSEGKQLPLSSFRLARGMEALGEFGGVHRYDDFSDEPRQNSIITPLFLPLYNVRLRAVCN